MANAASCFGFASVCDVGRPGSGSLRQMGPHSCIIPKKAGNVNRFAGKGEGVSVDHRWRRCLAVREKGPEEPEYAGVRCSVCKNELFRGEAYGADGERVLCAQCARDELMGLTDGEVLELMGFEVKRG